MSIKSPYRALKTGLKRIYGSTDPEIHLTYQSEIKPGSSALQDIFSRQKKGQYLGSNDTSAAVGFAPHTEQEKLILSLEKYLNSKEFKKEHPESGEDIKLMALRKFRDVELTVAMAFVDKYIKNEDDYFKKKAEILESINTFIDDKGGFKKVNVSLKALDTRGIMSNLNTYLTKAKKYFNHSDSDRLDILHALHYTHNMSISEIAEVANTYPNKILRDAKKLKFKQRSRSDIQKILLAERKKEHPTAGKTRDEETKLKISESMGKQWDNMDKIERDCRSQISKDAWEALEPDQKANIHRKANEAIRKTSKEGSKLEKYLYENLTNAGYKIQFHREHVLANEKMHLDIFIPTLGVVIEVDGPSHFENIWGTNHTRKVMKADNQKTAFCITLGFWMIRVQQKQRLSNRYQRYILSPPGSAINCCSES